MFLKLWITKTNIKHNREKALLLLFEICILDSFSCSDPLPMVDIVAAMICIFSFDTDYAFHF